MPLQEEERRNNYRNCFKRLFCITKEREENLRRMSFFGKTFSFSLARKRKFKTFIGGVISIIIMIFFLGYIGKLSYDYVNSSLIGDVITIDSFNQKSKIDLSKILRVVFWITKLEPGKEPETLKLADFDKYFDITADYFNEFSMDENGKKRQAFHISYKLVDCKKSKDYLSKKLLNVTIISRIEKFEHKVCFEDVKKTEIVDDLDPSDLKRMNAFLVKINHCVKSEKRPNCDEEEKKKTKFFVHHLNSERKVILPEIGKEAMIWKKNGNILEDTFDSAYFSRYIKTREEGRQIIDVHYYAETRYDITFEKIAKVIRKIPLAKYILKVFYNHEGPIVGFESFHTITAPPDTNFGGNLIGLITDNRVVHSKVQFFSILDFLTKVKKILLKILIRLHSEKRYRFQSLLSQGCCYSTRL